jgi:hypothetical protein
VNLALPKDDSIPEFLDRRPFVGTFTALSTFKSVCEHQAYRRYIKKDIPYVETEAMRWGKQVHSAFEHRLSEQRQPLPDNMRQWEGFAHPFDKYKVITEQKMGMTARATVTGFFDKDVWFRGISDAVVLQLEKATAFILDLKTGNSKYEDPFELATNALLLKMRYPELKKVVGSYAWLKENRMGQQYDVSDFKRTFIEVQRLMNLVASKRVSGEWIKRKSGLCSYCSVKDCENWRESPK